MTASLQQALRSSDPDQRSGAFETLVFETLRLGDTDLPGIASAYAQLSDAILQREAGAASGGLLWRATPAQERTHLWAAWALAYGWRTFERAGELLAEFKPPAGLVVELGSGWGPFGLRAALLGYQVRLVDAESANFTLSQSLFQAAGLGDAERRAEPARPSHAVGASCVAFPYSVWEMADPDGDPDRTWRWLRSFEEQTSPGGQLHLLEAGTQRSARGLMRLRDRAVQAGASILGPCMGVSSCPRLSDPRDWCHFTQRVRPGPRTRRMFDLARRRWQETHASWLVLGERTPEPGFRLLEIRPRGRAKVEAVFCGPSGLVTTTALQRHRGCFEALAGAEVGARYWLRLEELEPHGDGLRLVATGALSRASKA
jgi:hypothetical protein